MRANVASYRVPRVPVDGKAIVYAVLPESPYGEKRYDVYLDGRDPQAKMGSSAGGQYVCFDLMPGPHKILAKAENWAEIDISARAGDTLFIRLGPPAGLLNATIRLALVPDYEGKFHMQRSAPGTVTATVQPGASPPQTPSLPGQGVVTSAGGTGVLADGKFSVGTITRSRMVKGWGFRHVDLGLTLRADDGSEQEFFGRDNSTFISPNGETAQLKRTPYRSFMKKRVEIKYAIIDDATGGLERFENGKNGILTMRLLE
jgi:hypothetical protein